ncbi:MAG: hypothetical protein LBO69_07790 [Ignavibacteria bacterium]|jgi:hypothetical protein|nr:hypothetical protein [Ignavibacteria bacterium]
MKANITIISQFLLIASVIFLFYPTSNNANVNNYALLLDGMDTLKYYGMDTTGHWWAITKPFGKYRLYIDGIEGEVCDDITYPVISPDARQWSYYGYYNSVIHFIANEGDSIANYELDATDFGENVYSPTGEYLAYSYFQSGTEVIVLPNRTIKVTNRYGKLFIDNSGTSYTIMGKHYNSYVININGKESTTFDSIIPIGYWHNRDFIYAGFNGSSWDIYQGEKQIGTSYSQVLDAIVNKAGTILAMLVRLNTGRCMCIVVGADYYDPIYGKTYDNVWGLALHPTEMIYGYGATEHSRTFVVQSATEYNANGEIGRPFYSYNGDELIFTAMGEFGPYINVNGKKTDIRISLYQDDIIAKKPGEETIALPTELTLLIYNYAKNESYPHILCDAVSNVIYNAHSNRYEALGVINNRLYMLWE